MTGAVELNRARITYAHLNLRFTMADMDRLTLAARQGWGIKELAKLARVKPEEMDAICRRNNGPLPDRKRSFRNTEE